MVRTRSGAASAAAETAATDPEGPGAQSVTSNLGAGISMRALSRKWPFGRSSNDSAGSVAVGREASLDPSEAQSPVSDQGGAGGSAAPQPVRRRWGAILGRSRGSGDQSSSGHSPQSFEIGGRCRQLQPGQAGSRPSSCHLQ